MTGPAESEGINALAEQAPNPHFRNIRRLHCFMCYISSGMAGLIDSLNIISSSSLLRVPMRASPYSADLDASGGSHLPPDAPPFASDAFGQIRDRQRH